MTCPSYDDLLAWLEQPGAAEETAGHVDGGCPDCRRRLALLDTTVRALGRPAPPQPRPALDRAVLSALEAADDAPGPLERVLGAAREFLAELVSAPVEGALAAGLRGQSGSTLRRYRAGPFVLDVGVLDEGTLVGQLDSAESTDWPVDQLEGADVLLFTGERVLECQVDEFSGFRFEHVGDGPVALAVSTTELWLTFPDVDLGPAE